jgi:RNA polymerase sigma-70 factor, ECF subfamily
MSKDKRDNDVIGLLGPLRRYALSLTRDVGEAEDLVHDTLLRAFEQRAQFKSGHSLRPWLMSILHNRFVDQARRKRSERHRDEAIALHIEPSVSGRQEGSTRLADVHRAFMTLPEEQRAALHLVTVEGLSYEKAAETLSIPVGTLVSRLSRGRARLRELEEGPSDVRVLPFPAGGRRDAI